MYLPKNLLSKLIVGLFFSLVAISQIYNRANAASAYINPNNGRITVKTFLVSVYVESSTSEPEMASAKIKISYPASINVVSVNNGDFDTYLEKNNDTTAKIITINAVNNAGNYKSGKVKLASINFEAVQTTGQTQLTIDPQSEISGAGGEALLTETINSNYTLAVQNTDPVGSGTTEPQGGTSGTPEAPKTGVNDTAYYMLFAGALLASGTIIAVKNR